MKLPVLSTIATAFALFFSPVSAQSLVDQGWVVTSTFECGNSRLEEVSNLTSDGIQTGGQVLVDNEIVFTSVDNRLSSEGFAEVRIRKGDEWLVFNDVTDDQISGYSTFALAAAGGPSEAELNSCARSAATEAIGAMKDGLQGFMNDLSDQLN